jgi:hypothetical protein
MPGPAEIQAPAHDQPRLARGFSFIPRVDEAPAAIHKQGVGAQAELEAPINFLDTLPESAHYWLIINLNR